VCNGVETSPVYQLGYVVRDVDATVRFYEKVFGIGPFQGIPEVDMNGALLRGEPVRTKIKVAFAKSNGIEIELIEPLEGKNVYVEFLEARGEGIHHLGFRVDDMDAWKRKFSEAGFEPVFQKDMEVMEFAYYDTSEPGGLMLELLHWK